MLSSKVIGRAGRRRGAGRRGHDGQAQPRAVWATAVPTGRAPSSDGALGRARSGIRVSVLGAFCPYPKWMSPVTNTPKSRGLGWREVMDFAYVFMDTLITLINRYGITHVWIIGVIENVRHASDVT